MKKKENKNWHKPETNITCEKCSYEWHTDSTANRTRCPHCGYSTPNPNYVNVQETDLSLNSPFSFTDQKVGTT